MTKFGERLKTLRIEENVSRKQLASALNVSLRSISYWENNQRECDFSTLLEISEYFSVSIDYLLGKTDY